MQHMAVSPGTFVRAFSFAFDAKRSPLIRQAGDRGWRQHHPPFVDPSHINMVSQQALIKKSQNMSEAL